MIAVPNLAKLDSSGGCGFSFDESPQTGRDQNDESTPAPFDTLIAPLVSNDLVRVQKRVSGVRIVLIATEPGKHYGHAFL